MAIFRLDNLAPDIDPHAWVAETAHVIGHVRLAAGVTVWFGATIRGDNDWITLGANTNVQEGTVIHTDPGLAVNIGESVTIGHKAMLHGCTIGDGTLIGIQAVVLNGAKIGRECLIGAGALVTEGKEIPDRSVVMGSPARVIRQLTDEQAARLRVQAASYARRGELFRKHLERIA